MWNFKMRASALASLAVLASAAGFAQFAEAVTIDFESPAYSAGPITGQNGWAPPAFLGGGSNGTVEVSASSPLSGSQSLLYTRTDNTTFGADVFKGNVITVGTDGTSAADLNIGFQMAATSLSGAGLGYGVVGLAFGNAVSSGASPLAIRLNNAGHALSSIEVYAGSLAGVPAEGYYYLGADQPSSTFGEGDKIDFSLGVDFDLKTFTVAATNATTGVPFVVRPGPFGFAGGYSANGDGTYTVDALALLRFGSGRIDNITMTAIPEPTSCVLALAVLGGVACMRRRRSI